MSKKEYDMLGDYLWSKLRVTPEKNVTYFEGDLQLRNPNKELINFVSNQLNKRNIWVAKITPLKTGIDIKVSSQRFLRSLGKRIAKSYKGELKMSRSIFTRNRQTSKEVYRVTVCFIMDNTPKDQPE